MAHGERAAFKGNVRAPTGGPIELYSGRCVKVDTSNIKGPRGHGKRGTRVKQITHKHERMSAHRLVREARRDA